MSRAALVKSRMVRVEEVGATRDALAVRLGRAPRTPSDGVHRRVVAYAAPDVSRLRFASMLRELADELAEPQGDP
jgi:hypothetical protein